VADTQSSKRAIHVVDSHHASLDEPYDPSHAWERPSLRDQIYNSAGQEKIARAEEFSAIKRAVSKDTIVIADGLNYIKGYRYQLWCEAKAAGTRCCVVHVAAQEDECQQWNRERLRAWGRSDDADQQRAEGTQQDGPRGKDALHTVPESHTTIYGDRTVEKPERSRSSSVEALAREDGRADTARADDTMTLQSLYISDGQDPTMVTSNSNGTTSSLRDVRSLAARAEPPLPTSSPPYSPSTLSALMMRYEPPSPFSRWDTPLFTVPTTDQHPPYDAIWSAIFPLPVKPTSKKARSQLGANKTEAEDQIEQVKQHAATVLPRATASNALQVLESATMDVVKALLARARTLGAADGEGGTVSFGLSSRDAVDRGRKTSEGGEEGGPGHDHATDDADADVELDLHIPPGVTLSQPALQRLRRKYTQIQRGGIAHGQAYAAGRKAVIEGFVRFLDAEFNE